MADNTRAGEPNKRNWMARLIARAKAKGKNWRWSKKSSHRLTVPLLKRRGRDNLSIVVHPLASSSPQDSGVAGLTTDDTRGHALDSFFAQDSAIAGMTTGGSSDGFPDDTHGHALDSSSDHYSDNPGMTTDESPDDSFSSDYSVEPLTPVTPVTPHSVSDGHKPRDTVVRFVVPLDSMIHSGEDIHMSGLSSENITTDMHGATSSHKPAFDQTNDNHYVSSSDNNSSSSEDTDDSAFDKEPRHDDEEEPLSPTSFLIDGNEDRVDNSSAHATRPKDQHIHSVQVSHTHSPFPPDTISNEDNDVSLINPPDDMVIDSLPGSYLDVPAISNEDDTGLVDELSDTETHEGSFGPLPFQPDASGKETKVDLASLRLHAVDHTRIRQEADFPPSSSKLENLPSEMRLQILLQMPDLQTLRSLVHASPRMHKDYTGTYDRPKILAACLQREINDYFSDAYAVLMSQSCEIGQRVDAHIVEKFLCQKYKSWNDMPVSHFDEPYALPDGVHSLRLEQQLWLYTFHLHLVRPLTFRYCHWALDNIKKAVNATDTEQTEYKDGSTTTSQDHPPFTPGAKRHSPCDILLSRSEQIRIHRAFYRTQVFNQLWGQSLEEGNPESYRGVHWGDYSSHDVNYEFFGLFEPWEADAIASIDLFLRDQYTAIFAEIRDYFLPTNARFKDARILHKDGYEEIDGTHVAGYDYPEGSIDLGFEGREEYGNHFIPYMDGTISRGLFVTMKLFDSRDYEQLCGNAERWLIYDDHTDPIMGSTLERYRQPLDSRVEAAVRDLSDDSDNEFEGLDSDSEDSDDDSDTDSRFASLPLDRSRDKAMIRGNPSDFLGDSLPRNTPPLGWVLLWGGRYMNLWGDYTPEEVKRLGYVIWDERRWTDMGAKDIVAKQWENADRALKDELSDRFSWTPPDN
ncbi:hypothetical protein GGR57DRAFT_484827 [Xylariaceae sp. FL1272]|nr:hypothetical protein GGR57DRAFT_484827 [Xylariaceae sp. FL1272]